MAGATTKGISLVGFMQKPAGLKYLRNVCAFDGDQSDARLEHEWSQARQKLGSPMGRMGTPGIKDIPAAFQSYVDDLKNREWMKHRLSDGLSGSEFKMIEVDPLLAMQFSIDLDRTEHVCKSLSGGCSDGDLFTLCLPLDPPDPEVHHYKDSTQAGSMLVMTKNLSLGIVNEGRHEIETPKGYRLLVGIELNIPVPLVHVVRFESRYYLHNGFHRVYGARAAGATHVPCIVREVGHWMDIGIGPDTFSLDDLSAANPPTVGHYTNGRAYDIRLKSLTKVIQVSWSEYTV